MNKDNKYYNKSFKNLNNINNNLNQIINNSNYINNNNNININLNKEEEEKKDNANIGMVVENGMSQSEINGSGELYKNIVTNEKEQINLNKNILLNSQMIKKDKESVDNLKLFLDKLIDDLDNY